MDKLCIAWTTFGNKLDAVVFAKALIEKKLAFCVQIDSPCTSVYNWKEKVETAEEFRVSVKFFQRNQELVEDYVDKHHPYEIPQWLVLHNIEGGEGYLQWANEI